VTGLLLTGYSGPLAQPLVETREHEIDDGDREVVIQIHKTDIVYM